MSRAEAHEKLYQMVSDMTTVNGYNYTWGTRKGGDAYFGSTPEKPALITINILDEDNVDDLGGIGSNEYMDNADVEMYLDVTIPNGDYNASDTVYEEQLAMSRAIDDVKHRYSSNSELCDARVQSFLYQGADVQTIQEEDAFSTQRATCRFAMLYRSQRSL